MDLPFEPATVRGKALLFQTGWDAHWRTDQYFENHPHLTAELAEAKKKGGDNKTIDEKAEKDIKDAKAANDKLYALSGP